MQSKIILFFVVQTFLMGLLVGRLNMRINPKTISAVFLYFFVFFAIFGLYLKAHPDLINPWLKYGIKL